MNIFKMLIVIPSLKEILIVSWDILKLLFKKAYHKFIAYQKVIYGR